MYYGDGNNEHYDCCQYYPARGGRPVCRTALNCAAAYGACAFIDSVLFLCGLGYCSPFCHYVICKIDLLTAFTFLPVPGVVAFPLGGEGMYVRRGYTIAHLKIDKIISSDLLRARETAEIVNEEINKRVSFDTRIKEVGFGLLEGIKIENITPKLWDAYNLNPEVIEAESKEHVFERVKEFFDELQFSKDNILIVTHGGILRMIMYYSKNKEKFYKDKYLEFKNVKIKNVDIFEWKDELKVYKKEG